MVSWNLRHILEFMRAKVHQSTKKQRTKLLVMGGLGINFRDRTCTNSSKISGGGQMVFLTP